ncbi:LytTR family DNA-binding domain-containing protein [Erythrobacter sp.]|uniref:LytTR family DNA-binding domain-containing protein n=1 Tax=Erythrobacter sp. TaxID=1042 RepID=UPI001425C691|nr:LytTR family DNA-binding domain-containing protein [Erythrobacter sp.]QIQ87878.1 MAG: LytTR family transcriptional regulator [Erythrobacter sp.]
MVEFSVSPGDTTRVSRAPLLRRLAIDLAVMTVVGLFLAVIGPFGSIEMPLAWRLVTWLGFAYAGYAIYRPMGLLVDRAEAALDLPRPALWFVATLAATVPMAVLVWVAGSLPPPIPVPGLEQALVHYLYVFVIGGGIVLLFHALRGRRGVEEDPGALPGERLGLTIADQDPLHAMEPALARGNPLLEQLPAELGSEVIALEMEDHYVRVHTALGSDLVLMRMRDAVAHLSASDGRQVHRSWWVARGAVEDVKREGRNVRLVLPRGLEAPVARAQVAELRDAGWF